jgi:hypothetical protein
MELLGTPPDELINQATRRRLFFGMFNTSLSSFFVFTLSIIHAINRIFI